MNEQILTTLRERMDELDSQIVELLNQRAATAKTIGAAKKGAPVYRPERERQVLQNVMNASAGTLPDKALDSIYREIIAACRNIQRPLRVAYLGPEGTYSEEAARKQCGATSTYLPFDSIEAVFHAVESGEADVAVVPVENSSVGAVKHTVHRMQQSPLTKCGEVSVPIHHQLLTNASDLDKIKEVIAHPQSLAQCSAWLNKNLPDAKRTEASSNAAAVIQATQNSNMAAIASERAGQIYELPVLAQNIEDDPTNTTHFLLLNRAEQKLEPTAMQYISDLAPYQPGLPIAHVARQYHVDENDIIKLASNENPLGPSPKALQAMQNALPDMHRYPEQHTLLQKLSQHLGTKPEALVLGNGSNDVLDLIARAYLAPGAEAISSQYAFAMYQLVTQAAGAKNVVVPAAGYSHNLDTMLGAITPATKIIWIANPNNPTGTFIRYDRIKEFMDQVPKHVLVVLDEAYYEYLDKQERVDSVAWLQEYPNLILVRTFSKIYGLAGLRLGYGVMSAEIAELINRVRQPFNGNSVALAAATAALDDQAFVAESYRANLRGRDQLLGGLYRLGIVCLPAHGNFIACRVPDAQATNEKLLKDGVIARPLAGYGMPDWLRVTIGLPAENERFLASLAKAHR